MAKKEKIDSEEYRDEILNEVTETEVADEKVVEVRAASTTKKVRIHTVEEINSIIGCMPYVFPKDKDVLVPSDVAAILCFSKKAYRL